MNNWRKELVASRVRLLKEMDRFVHNSFNDEDFIMVWLMDGCPDASTEEDYEYIAEDDKEFGHMCELFGRMAKMEIESWSEEE